MVYHRSSSRGSSMADTAARRSARDDDDYCRTREDRDNYKHSNYNRGNSRYKDKYSESSRSKNNKDEGKYADSSRYSKDVRGRERDDRYHERSRDMREDRYRDDGSRYRDGREESSKYRDMHDDGRYREGKDGGCYSEGSSQYESESRNSDRYGGRYSEGSRYSSRGSRYSSERGEGHGWYSDYSQHRDNSRKCSESRYEGSDSEYSENKRYTREDSHSIPETSTSPVEEETSVVPEQEKLQNMFQNDGSFLEMFKKMQEANKPPSETETTQIEEGSSSTAATDKSEPASRGVGLLPRKGVPIGIVGKRRGGRVLPTGMVKKQKREDEVEETPKDAWSIYMAEVRKYKQATCEEEGKTRPLVKYLKLLNKTDMAKVQPSEVKLETCPFDPRFPNMNQTRHCWQSYVDYYRCQNLRGEDYEPCNYFKKCYKSLCPKSWINKWDTQREEGRFPGRLTV